MKKKIELINEKEIELHDTIKDIIKNSMNDVFSMQTNTILEFEDYWDLNLSEAEFVAADKIEELEENDKNGEENSCILEENKIINKKKLLNSGKLEKGTLFFINCTASV